jgi:2-amino-4-hydroxy-6-hydroxymethyldihydropteridine diphosphokinase
MNQLVILLGCNLGNCEITFHKAIESIENELGKCALKSSFYKTKAWGNENQNDFLNQCLIIETAFSAAICLEKILKIEESLGRKREEKWGPRTIDIDILFFNSEIVDKPNLQIPHPYLHLRRFTLEPLHELIPDFIHPVLNQKIGELLLHCKDELKVIKN